MPSTVGEEYSVLELNPTKSYRQVFDLQMLFPRLLRVVKWESLPYLTILCMTLTAFVLRLRFSTANKANLKVQSYRVANLFNTLAFH